jgi:hypothetical protein
MVASTKVDVDAPVNDCETAAQGELPFSTERRSISSRRQAELAAILVCADGFGHSGVDPAT